MTCAGLASELATCPDVRTSPDILTTLHALGANASKMSADVPRCPRGPRPNVHLRRLGQLRGWLASQPVSTVSFVAAHSFSVVFEDAGDGWVYAHVPELPEVQTQGESLDQARQMVREAITLVLEERGVRGEAIPPKGWALVESVEIAA